MVKADNGSVMHQDLLETDRHVHMEFMCTTLPTTIMTGSFLSYVHHSRQTQTPTVTCLYALLQSLQLTEFDSQLMITDMFTVLFYRWCQR